MRIAERPAVLMTELSAIEVRRARGGVGDFPSKQREAHFDQLRDIVDRYNRAAKQIIDSVSR